MKVKVSSNLVFVEDIKIGHCFSVGPQIYMRTDTWNGKCPNIVNLETGTLTFLDRSAVVLPLDLKVVLNDDA